MKIILNVLNHSIDVQALAHVYSELSKLKSIFKVKKAIVNEELSFKINGNKVPSDFDSSGNLPFWAIEVDVELTEAGTRIENIVSRLTQKLNQLNSISVINIDELGSKIDYSIEESKTSNKSSDDIPKIESSKFGFLMDISFNLSYKSLKTNDFSPIMNLLSIFKQSFNMEEVQRYLKFVCDFNGNISLAEVKLTIIVSDQLKADYEKNIAYLKNRLELILVRMSMISPMNNLELGSEINLESKPANERYKVDERISTIATEYSVNSIKGLLFTSLNSAQTEYADTPHTISYGRDMLGRETLKTFTYQPLNENLTLNNSSTLFNRMNSLSIESPEIKELKCGIDNMVKYFPDLSDIRQAVQNENYNEAYRLACAHGNSVLVRLIYSYHVKKIYQIDFNSRDLKGKSALDYAKETGNAQFFNLVNLLANAIPQRTQKI